MEKSTLKINNEDRQNFVATRMSLPLFMVSRNRIRRENLPRVEKQFKLAGQHYNEFCQKENRREAFSKSTFDHYRHITGFDKTPKNPYPERRRLHIDRTMTKWRGWQLPPNHYGVPPEPYLRLKGTKGSVFAKPHTNHSRVSIKPPPYHFYELPAEIERLFKRPNLQKGIFLSNARDRRPTTHAMISNLSGCWRNPKDAGPCDTHTNIFELAANAVPITKAPRPNPHLFLRHSCVPTKPNRLIRRHISMEPAPGRYCTSYPNVCPCPAGKTSVPGLQLMIDDQKRLKFRRQPFERISRKRLCEPDWRHVEGQGHRHVFLMGRKDRPKPTKKPTSSKKQGKPINMYADSKYINMLSQPQRHPISIRQYPVPPYVPKITYNCAAKRVIRKQLKNNKKIAFNSGQERWKDGERPMQLTARQLEAIKQKLPPERRLMDYPIELPEVIPSRLTQVPDHQRVTYMPKLRKRLFKFLPIPGARVLVTDSDIRPDIVFDPEHPTGLYRRKIDETAFYKDSVLRSMENREESDATGLNDSQSQSQLDSPHQSMIRNTEGAADQSAPKSASQISFHE
ncbi:uncharacterized protein LOC6735376 [Drosophila simulans]|uniref:Uncharacterized protein n=1 Tax=Drosophila simulans TaxID=7240 RepID=A0A0J9RH86_DROSI|nr:uncharacterized protein LOC6735376 [Drosophila simulans]KMY95257.1 uncharacterized protein Dsimw501_GD11512 [Drosophila simulans]